jgi:hypothetical protein
MALPDAWTIKTGTIADYLEAIKQAQAPERFSTRFLEGLGYKATNDRKFIGVLRSLGFLDADGKPTSRYYEYLDLSRSEVVLANAIREAYADLFAVNKDAHKLTTDQVKNKLRTLYAGAKKDTVVAYIAATFAALVKCADFETAPAAVVPSTPAAPTAQGEGVAGEPPAAPRKSVDRAVPPMALGSLQYHINIVLPESRDQAVYDAIFKALRDHLG